LPVTHSSFIKFSSSGRRAREEDGKERKRRKKRKKRKKRKRKRERKEAHFDAPASFLTSSSFPRHQLCASSKP